MRTEFDNYLIDKITTFSVCIALKVKPTESGGINAVRLVP